MNMYRKGINTKMVFRKDLEDVLVEFQKSCMPQDTTVGIIETFLDITDAEYVCVQMIWEKALNNEKGKPKQYESREITNIMRLEFADQWEEVSSHRFKNEGYGMQIAWKRAKPKEEFVEVENADDIPFLHVTLDDTESNDEQEEK